MTRADDHSDSFDIAESADAGVVTVDVDTDADAQPSPAQRAVRAPLIGRHFTQPGEDVYARIEWTFRTAAITSDSGETIFEQTDIETPAFWSQTATNIVASKYFWGPNGSPQRESSMKTLVDRVVNTISRWGRDGGYFSDGADASAFAQELRYLLINQYAAFNSPVWFNVGIEETPQCSACFINSVEDSMESIMDLAKREALLFKWGSGTGSNLSTLRSSREALTGGGKASGPVSFMRGYDAFANVIKSGGKTRRAAKMIILNADHPDVLEFINCKADEERKAWALIDAGYDGSFTGAGVLVRLRSRTPTTAVRVPDEFMRAVLEADGEPGQTRARWSAATAGSMQTCKAREILMSPWWPRVRISLRRPGDAVRHHHQRLAHLPAHGSDQRVESLLRVHVPRRLGVQPGVAQPDASFYDLEDGAGEFDVESCRARGAGPDDHRPGDYRRQTRQLSHRR